MSFEFDPAKDKANIAKHGISLVRAVDLEVLARIIDERFDEPLPRLRPNRRQGHCLAYAIRGAKVRAINLRRAREKEIKRYVPEER